MAKKELYKKENKRIILKSVMTLMSLVIIISMINFASAEFWQCFNKGDKVNYCGAIKDRTAPSDNYKLCMEAFNSALNCYVPGNWNVCNTKPPACGLDNGGDTTLDITPPVITLNSPTNNSLYNGRHVLLDFDINEYSDVYYLDMINGKGRWNKICKNCNSYSNSRSFKDGINVIRLKAVDRADNEAFKDVTFFIDSEKPRIYSLLPKKGFANGNFEIEYTELNLDKINLTYGNLISGFNTVNLASCPNGVKAKCNISVNLANYNGEQISYYFSVKDKAGSVISSKQVTKLGVDTQAPILNLMTHPINGKYVEFTFNVTEANLDVIQYKDLSESKPRFKSMCTKLKDGICEKKLTLKSGHHELLIEILDDAGNKITRNLSIDI